MKPPNIAHTHTLFGGFFVRDRAREWIAQCTEWHELTKQPTDRRQQQRRWRCRRNVASFKTTLKSAKKTSQHQYSSKSQEWWKRGKKSFARQVLNDTHAERARSECGEKDHRFMWPRCRNQRQKDFSLVLANERHTILRYILVLVSLSMLSLSRSPFSILSFLACIKFYSVDTWFICNDEYSWYVMRAHLWFCFRRPRKKKIAFSSSSSSLLLFLHFTLCKQYRTVVFVACVVVECASAKQNEDTSNLSTDRRCDLHKWNSNKIQTQCLSLSLVGWPGSPANWIHYVMQFALPFCSPPAHQMQKQQFRLNVVHGENSLCFYWTFDFICKLLHKQRICEMVFLLFLERRKIVCPLLVDISKIGDALAQQKIAGF